MEKYKWPLNTINHSYLDRIKLALFFLNKKNRWTIGNKVEKFEHIFAKFLGVKYVIATSSGSTANSILSHYWKDKNIKEFNNGKNHIIFNGISWSTNVNPWIRDGFIPIFLDINLENFSIDCDKLEKFLIQNCQKISCIFCTGLIGYSPNIEKLELICNKYKIKLFFDFCESSLSQYYNKSIFNIIHIGKNHTHTHSFYLGHLICGCELGCIATNDEYEYQEFLLYRNHGLLRSLEKLKNVKIDHRLYQSLQNELVDDSFSFARIGNNYRPTEINAYTAILDLNRINYYILKRKLLFEMFYKNIDKQKFYLPKIIDFNKYFNVHFCLPLIINKEYKKDKYILFQNVQILLDNERIERRPIISSTFTRQRIYQKYGNHEDLENCEYITKMGCYIGLYPQLKISQIIKLTKKLNII